MSESPPNDRLEELFQRALEQPESSRDEWLIQECGGDASLLDQLRELLRANEQNADALLDGITADAFAEQVPTQIGVYRVSRLIGTGGMSAVFDAIHTGTNGRAAVKVIRVGLATTRQRVRFQIESELLAKLNHPGIAHLFDAGQADVTYADGSSARRMFIAMEFVEGRSIGKHCEAAALTIRQRVELIERVARAVQHAHESGVIHRDLKPANILVTSDGAPKVVDFGIARLVGPDRRVTMTGVIMGTPSYMSPEQMRGQHDAVSTRSDVYSLAAVLYELLAGRPPIETPSALTPSAAFSMLHAEPQRVGALKTDVPRDLDAVVHKALDRKPERRYPTAREFADDLHRWLSSLPVEARQPSVADRVRLQFRRRPKLAAGVVVGSFSLLTLGSMAVWQAIRATRASRVAIEQRDEARRQSARADQQAKIAEAVSKFMREDVLIQASSESQLDAGHDADPDIKISTALDRAAATVAERFKDQPPVEAAVRASIAQAYAGIGKFKQAAEHFKRAAELEGAIDPRSRACLDARRFYATSLAETGDFATAIPLLRQAFADAAKILGDDDELTIDASVNLDFALQQHGDVAEAVALLPQQIARAKRVLGASDRTTLMLRNHLAQGYSTLGRYADALKESEAVLELTRKALGPNHIDTLTAMNNFALQQFNLSNFAAASEIFVEALAIAQEKLGDDHPMTILIMNNLAGAYGNLGQTEKAIELHRKAYEASKRVNGPEHPETLSYHNDLGERLLESGQFAQALAIFQSTLPLQVKLSGSEDMLSLRTARNVARALAGTGRDDEALASFQQLVPRFRAALGEDHGVTLMTADYLVLHLIKMKRFADAEPIARDDFDRARRALGLSHQNTQGYAQHLAYCLTALNRPDEAAAVRATTQPTSRP